jgi:hypothetical protein
VYRTAVFRSDHPNEWQFDEHENPMSPGSRQLAENIVAMLGPCVAETTPVEQHSFYGWAFCANLDGFTFDNVLSPGDGECYLTILLRGYWLKKLLMRRPREAFDRYCELVNRVLNDTPGFSDIIWEDYRN